MLGPWVGLPMCKLKCCWDYQSTRGSGLGNIWKQDFHCHAAVLDGVTHNRLAKGVRCCGGLGAKAFLQQGCWCPERQGGLPWTLKMKRAAVLCAFFTYILYRYRSVSQTRKQTQQTQGWYPNSYHGAQYGRGTI